MATGQRPVDDPGAIGELAVMDDRLYPDLDYKFLRYIGAVPEKMRYIQGHYLPFFEGRRRVLDLACGDGDFIEMLTEQGVCATGVDFDPRACEAVRGRGLDVVCQDVLDYLERVEPESFDGIFSAHLVEHLSYHQVLRMLELGLRALEPGGIMLLATPNTRSMYAHLESFYKHFGHTSFYHPELLCFFLDYVGFVEPQTGENPRMGTPLWGQTDVADFSPTPYFDYERVLPLASANPLRRLFRIVKMFTVRMVVQPYTDQLIARLNELVTHVNLLSRQLAQVAQREEQVRATLDKSVECFAYAHKPIHPPGESGQDND